MSVTITPTTGTLSSTGSGTEDQVFEVTSAGVFRGYIDLTNLAGVNATIIVREYIKLSSGGSYKQVNEASYYGEQVLANSSLELPTRDVAYAYKVTLADDGSTKSFPYLEVEIG